MTSSSRLFFTSDHHFGQKSFHKFNGHFGHYMRPHWSNHNEFIDWYIDEYNKLVSEDDIVYFLGDFAAKPTTAEYVYPKLNGKLKVLVMGNHDIHKKNRYAKLFDQVAGLVIKKGYYILGHAGSHPKELEVYNALYNFHGHLHKNDYGDLKYVNCCVDYNGGKQIAIEFFEDTKQYKVHYGD